MDALVPVFPSPGPVPRDSCSAGIRAGSLPFGSGQIALAPDGTAHADADPDTQTHLCLANLRAALEAGSATLEQVGKVTVYLCEPDGWPVVDRVYTEFYGAHKPARAIVPVSATQFVHAVFHRA